MYRNHQKAALTAPAYPPPHAGGGRNIVAVAGSGALPPGDAGHAAASALAIHGAAFRTVGEHPVTIRGVKRFHYDSLHEDYERLREMPAGTRLLANLDRKLVYFVDPSMTSSVTWARGNSLHWLVLERTQY